MRSDVSDPSEAELVARARAGDGPALDALIARHQGRVYRFALKMCPDPEEAKDVLQDTLLAMARGIREFRGDASLSTWLYTIARSYCIKRRRKRHDDDALEPELAIDPGLLPDEALESQEVGDALEQAIDALDPMYREALVLRDVEGLTAPEVAQVLGITPQAVKTRLHRARLAVRARVARLLMPTPAPAAEAGCPDVLRVFSQHLEDEISAADCAEMERHVASCPSCGPACESLKRTLTLCRASPAAEVPANVQRSVKFALRNMLQPPG